MTLLTRLPLRFLLRLLLPFVLLGCASGYKPGALDRKLAGLADGPAGDLNKQNKFGRTPLHYMALRNHAAFLKRALAAGGDHSVKDRWGATPLHLAARKANPKSVAALLAAGADINARDKAGETPLHELTWAAAKPHEFWATSRGGVLQPSRSISSAGYDYERAREFCFGEDGRRFVFEWRTLGRSGGPQWHCLRNRKTNQYFLIAHEDLNTSGNNWRDWHKALVRVSCARNYKWVSCYPDMNDFVATAKLLLSKGAKINARDNFSVTPLFRVFGEPRNGMRQVGIEPTTFPLVKVLIDGGAELRNVRDPRTGDTILHRAVRELNSPAVKYIMSTGRADLNALNRSGATPYSVATNIMGYRDQLAGYLRSKGGRLHGWPRVNSSLCSAAAKGRANRITRASRGTLSTLSCRDSSGIPTTPIHIAAGNTRNSILKSYLGRGLPADLVDAYGTSVLSVALRAGNASGAKLLINAGANVHLTDALGYRPLSYALEFAPGAVDALLKKGAHLIPELQDPTDYDRARFWPVMQAIRVKRNDLAERVIKHENISRYRRETAREMLRAAERGWNEDAVDLVRDARIVPGGDKNWLKHSNKSNWEYAQEQRRKELAKIADIRKVQSSVSRKRGSFTATLSGKLPKRILGDTHSIVEGTFEFNMYVPRGYSGSKPYGLFIFSHGSKHHGKPASGWARVMDRHNYIYIGYPAYAHDTYFTSVTPTPRIAAGFAMARFNIDRNRVVLSGFSLGGRVTCSKMSFKTHIFRAGIPMAGCRPPGSGANAVVHDNEHFPPTPIVFTTSDQDYNRMEMFQLYRMRLLAGRRNTFFIQETGRRHSRLTAAGLDKALTWIEAAWRQSR